MIQKEYNGVKITVYGLGIIGASLCAALKRAGHTVYGRNRSREPIEYALAHGMIDGATDSCEGADVVFLALPPRIIMKVLDTEIFSPDTVVADICGVKCPIEEVVFAKSRNYRYVGTHPMAGKETSGIKSASATLFDGANLILTPRNETNPEALATVKTLGKEMGFTRIVECSAVRHDRMIALTSQLAHVVSNAYVKSPLTDGCVGFTGGSFQDMTRIAGVDAEVWTELFFLNRQNLIDELNRLSDSLNKYADALKADDEEEMKGLLKEGKDYRNRFLCKN